MGSRLILYSLAGTMVFGGCLDRKTGSPDANPNEKVDSSLPDAPPDNPQAVDSDGLKYGVDVALAGPDGDVPLAAPGLDGATTGSGGILGSTGGATGAGGILGSTGGATGSGGAIGTGGVATTVGSTARGGNMATGGVFGTGGVIGTGGIIGTGGANGTGGITGTGGATCQPKSRDCTSSLDNNCNGTPDNQETTYCACTVGNSQACLEHPGYDGKGICKAGSQTCALSTDKTTSSWGTCTPGVAPGTRNCTSTADNDCNGTPDKQETAYCQCAAGTSGSCQPAGACTAGTQACTASSDNTTTSWGACGGYTSPTLMYRDFDGDGYGDPSSSAQVCPGTAGYKTNNDDCDDGNAAFHPDLSICSSATQKRTCTTGSHGVPTNLPCDYGCMAGQCRDSTYGMVGVPGYVSCLTSNPQRCLAGDGCKTPDGTCGYSTEAHFTCDGPSDCTGQDCWLIAVFGWLEAKCSPTKPTDSTVYKVCDPLASTCASPLTCTRYGSAYSIFVCQ